MTLTTTERQTVEAGGNVLVTIEGIRCVIVRADVFDEIRKDQADEWTEDQWRDVASRTFEDADVAERIEP